MPQIRDTKYKIHLPVITTMLLMFLWGAGDLSAATLSLSGAERVAVDQPFTVDVALLTTGEQVNAVEADVLYDRSVLELAELREDGSAISVWLERPQRVEYGMVRFSGVIPGGSPLAKSPIVTLVFQPLSEGNARVWFQNGRAFLNDGLGTQVPLSFKEYVVTVLGGVPDIVRDDGGQSIPDSKDITPPEKFLPAIGKDESVYDGKWFVAFSATDGQSGTDHYEIMETKNKIRDTKYKIQSDWIMATSPYLLRDQSLQSYIYVKAVDRAGNERVVAVEPQNMGNWNMWIVFSVIALLAVVGWKYRFSKT